MPATSRFPDYVKLCQWPLERDLCLPFLAYRITTPLIAYILHLRGPEGIIVQYLMNVLTFGTLYLAMRKRADALIALLTCVGLSLTPVASSPNTWWGVPDSTTHFATALAMLSPSPWVIGFATVFGGLNDERFFMILPLIFIWHGMKHRPMIGAGMGLLIVLLIRMALTKGWIGLGVSAGSYNMVTGDIWNSVWEIPARGLLGSVFSFRWMWLFVFVYLLRNFNPLLFLSLLAVVVASSFPYDVSRNIAYAFPAVAYSIVNLPRHVNLRIFKYAIVLCLLAPGCAATGITPQWLRPLPISLVRAMREHRGVLFGEFY